MRGHSQVKGFEMAEIVKLRSYFETFHRQAVVTSFKELLSNTDTHRKVPPAEKLIRSNQVT